LKERVEKCHMKNQELAKIFTEIAELLELKGENVFRIRAYQRAAQNIGDMAKDVTTLSDEEITAIPGIGKDLTAKIHEYLETGKIDKHEKLKEEIPESVLGLLTIPGLGPKKVMMLFETLRITNIEDLETAIRSDRLAGLPGFGKKTEENILKGIERVKRGTERIEKMPHNELERAG
jgi:DNA polymerase (family 10)